MIFHSEWIVLFLLAVVLLKPEEVPFLAKKIGKVVRYAKNLWHQIIGDHFIDEYDHNFKKHPFFVAPLGAKIQPIKD